MAYKGQYRITIPKDLAEAKRWKPGTRLRFVELADGSAVLKEFEEAEEEIKGKKNGNEAGRKK